MSDEHAGDIGTHEAAGSRTRQPGVEAGGDPAGDVASSFEALAMPHLDAVARFALSLTRQRSAADDLVQETYLRALEGWHTFRHDDCRRWLFTVCRNTFLRLVRREARMESIEGDDDALPAVRRHSEAKRAGYGDLFETIDVGPAIRAAIEALPEPHHSVIVLVDVEDLSYGDAAAILGVPVGTVRSRLFRARRFIQEALVEHARDAGIVRASGAPQSTTEGTTEAVV